MENKEIKIDDLEQVSGGTGYKYYAYVVKKGDTLSKIAKAYGTTVDAIYQANRDKIKNKNLIQIGWELLIPVKA